MITTLGILAFNGYDLDYISDYLATDFITRFKLTKNVYIYIYVCVYVYVYIYVCMYMYIDIYIYLSI